MKPEIILLVMGILIVIGSISGMVYYSTLEPEIEKVSCYDRYGSEIGGLTCEKNINEDKVIIMSLFSFLGLLFVMNWYILDMNRIWRYF